MEFSVEERLFLLQNEMQRCANRIIALEFITRAMISGTNLTAADVLALIEPRLPNSTPQQRDFIEAAMRDFFAPVEGTQRAQQQGGGLIDENLKLECK